MMMANAYEKYKTQEIKMASPMSLIVMLYNGCIKSLKLARLAIEKKGFEEANKSLQKAQDILAELMMSLDLKYEISGELMQLYRFVYGEIVQINVSKKTEKIEPIINILSSLRDTWVKVEKECKPAPYELRELEQ